MNKRKRLLALVLAWTSTLVLLFAFAGCGRVSYSAFESHAESLVRPAYMEEHTLPSHTQKHTVLIHDEKALHEIFTDFPHKVNFKRQTVVFYMFISRSPRICYMDSITLRDGSVHICYTPQTYEVEMADSCAPYQQVFYLIVNSPNVHSASFEMVFH